MIDLAAEEDSDISDDIVANVDVSVEVEKAGER